MIVSAWNFRASSWGCGVSGTGDHLHVRQRDVVVVLLTLGLVRPGEVDDLSAAHLIGTRLDHGDPDGAVRAVAAAGPEAHGVTYTGLTTPRCLGL